MSHRVQFEVNDEGPRRIAPDDMVWLSINGEGQGMTVAEWLALVPRPPGLDSKPVRQDLSPANIHTWHERAWGRGVQDGGTIT